MAVAVAYWMLGLTGTFTRYEKLEFTYAYVVKESVTITCNGNNTELDSAYVVKVKLKNTGSAAASLEFLAINGIPWDDLDGALFQSLTTQTSTYESTENVANATIGSETQETFIKPTTRVTIAPGEEVTGIIVLDPDDWTSGITIEVNIQTSAGNQYPKTITLP
jgi:hypothetical protein